MLRIINDFSLLQSLPSLVYTTPMDTKPTKSINLPEPTSLPELTPLVASKDTPTSQIEDSDFELMNLAAIHLYAHWSIPTLSAKQLSTLMKTTISFTKHRRALMEMDYDDSSGAKKGNGVVYPLA